MAEPLCFDCLRRRIQSDSSDRLVFCYALSDSAFPIASTSVVQLFDSSASPSQFLLTQLATRPNSCFANYVAEYTQNQDLGVSDGDEVTLLQSGSCGHLGKFSCARIITALASLALVTSNTAPATATSSFCSVFDEILMNSSYATLEDHILCSLCLFLEGKASGRDSVNFLALLGVPSFEDTDFPGSLKHPNIAPVIVMLKCRDYVNLLVPKTPCTLENILHYSPNALNSEWHINFVIYQLLSALAYIHGLGVSHRNINPSSVMMTESYWVWLRICDEPGWLGSDSSSKDDASAVVNPTKVRCCLQDCPSQGLYADMKLLPNVDWQRDFNQWWRGEMSNFEYLLVLNKLAGRRWGDHTFHTVMPWVIDFNTRPDENSDAGWRDLSKSKWRLAKGDEQLDFTYSTSEIPHHVSDECLSELAVCSYKARRLPLSVLRMAVRSVYEPNEYPSTMQRLYQWTPDECIPEFYCDPQIFRSLHSGMTDLSVPSWAGSAEEFIKLHHDALESDRVSHQIHHWIDITFGYKMSGQAAVAAKNVMLPSSEPMVPRSVGRRQLFTRPHPRRRGAMRKSSEGTNESAIHQCNMNEVGGETSLLSETTSLQELEEASAFSEHARHLTALYGSHSKYYDQKVSSVEHPLDDDCKKMTYQQSSSGKHCGFPFSVDTNYLLEYIEVGDEDSVGYQELLLWRQKSSCSTNPSMDIAKDIFSVGCILAELHLGRPLFDSTSLAMYLESGVLPGLILELPPHTRVLVEACIEKDWMRRPSAKCLLESPYFSTTVKASYLFLAPLHLLAKHGSRLQYAATFAMQGAIKAMGPFAAEMSAPYCLSLIVATLSDVEAEWAYTLLKELIKCLKPKSVKTMILPAMQKILQTTGYSHLKVSLLQNSLMREIWNQVGRQTYLEMIHPLVISNLHAAAHKSSAAPAAVLLIGSSEELGVPITIHQTILPLIHCFGKGLCSDGIDVLVRIGSLLGETFIVRQILPLLKHVVHSCIGISNTEKPEPVQNWSALALSDCLMTIAGLVTFLPKEVVLKELIEDQNCLHVLVLMQTGLEIGVLQVAATTLMSVCQQIGPELTALHILPQLKELFDELAFSQETVSSSLAKSLKVSKPKNEGEAQIDSRMDLDIGRLLLYPSFASLLGIEKLRQCCATWLLLEQYLLRYHSWKWEYTGESNRSGSETLISKRLMFSKGSTPEYHPAKLLLNGVGWSIPQSQGSRGAKNSMPQRRISEVEKNPVEMHAGSSNFVKFEPWFWFPKAAASWDGPDFLGRVGGLKDEHPWKIRASVIYSVRAHQGAIRSLAVCQDECTVFTAGIGPGFKGTVQRWELTRVNSLSSYYGHEEVVNDICILSSTGRVASCDGTIHVWNSRTGKLTYLFAESSSDSAQLASHLSSASKINPEQANMINSSTLSGGLLTNAFDGSLYTCMHQREFDDKLIVGTGNGSLRFIDVARGQKLHLWRGEYAESGFPSLVSSICSCGSDKSKTDGASASPSWIAAGLSSGQCRLFDARSGNVIASWRAHEGYVTKLAAPEEHLLVSSSLDRTLRIWDLRRNFGSQPTIFRGHKDGVSSFSVWGQDIISISRNKIGLSSLSKSADEDGRHRIVPQYLYMAEQGTRNLSLLSSISILPFSRLFAVGTEDGYLRICC
ncbi:Regulatory associated protein of TOR [Parasponia andersonii]|uniref:Regulatory associated protein of TOR n=1 Tax=Parasponia andersonii TaxID=3476 RepID=A0A2P5D536_PARAD|nr:Regulatory associated protein of TOR [Parasponia andersonii]